MYLAIWAWNNPWAPKLLRIWCMLWMLRSPKEDTLPGTPFRWGHGRWWTRKTFHEAEQSQGGSWTGMFFIHCWDMCPYNCCRAGFQIIRKWWLLCPTLKGSFSLFLCLLQHCIWYVGWDGVLWFLGGQIMRSLIQTWRNYSRPGDSGLWGNSSVGGRGIPHMVRYLVSGEKYNGGDT